MSIDSPSILFIDDDADVQKSAALLAERRGMRLLGARDPGAAWVLHADTSFDVVLLDLNFSRGDTSGDEGLAMLPQLLAADPNAVVIVVTGFSGINVAVEAMRNGASDFVIKLWNNERLLSALDRGIALRRARTAQQVLDPDEERLILGEDRTIVRLRNLVSRLAATDASVLITGPAGSGKSLFARAIHRASALSERPLSVVAGVSIRDRADLLESMASARGGTLLLEEIEALPPWLGPELAEAQAAFRIIATSRRDRSNLRASLDPNVFFRISTIEIAIPPLGDRGGDVLLLARHFLDRFAARHGRVPKPLTEKAAGAILAHHWQDDVRELRQLAERAVLLGSGDVHDVDDFIFPGETVERFSPVPDLNLARNERELVEAALRRHGFNVTHAAADLGLTRTALYRRMAKYGF